MATKLKARRWVRRAPDPSDGRATLASLTTKGREQLECAAPEHVESVRQLIFDGLTPAQVRQLRNINRRIQAAIAPQGSLLS